MFGFELVGLLFSSARNTIPRFDSISPSRACSQNLSSVQSGFFKLLTHLLGLLGRVGGPDKDFKTRDVG
jgi:hypothetical protein